MRVFLPMLSVLLLATFCKAQTSTLPEIVLEDFAGGFDTPIDVQSNGDGYMYVVEQPGKIRIVTEDGFTLAKPFLDISDEVLFGGEQGLLGLAFHPDYADNGYFYVNYVNKGGKTVIARFTRSAGNYHKADRSSEMEMLKIPHPFVNHYGGGIRFGPDGYLYFAIGDGGAAGDPFNNAQDPSRLLGKMMRIDVNSGEPYTIPADNPFVGMAGYMPEIWALGLRNPFRWSFDKLTGDLWIGDVGQDMWEEVNVQRAGSAGGQNYGWDCMEGEHPFEPGNCDSSTMITDPVTEYPHDGSDCTVIGGFVYRGSNYPNMYGKYIYMDYCSGRFRTIFKYGGEKMEGIIGEEDPFSYVSFGEDVDGELYVVDNVDGEIYHVADATSMRTGAYQMSSLKLFPNPASDVFTIEFQGTENGDAVVEIDNLLGETIMREEVGSVEGYNNYTFNSTNLEKGSYVLTLKTAKGDMHTAFVVQ